MENHTCREVAVFFSVSVGVNAGYHHSNQLPENITASQIVAREWQDALEKEFAASGILVGGIVSEGRVVYPSNFGCPLDGEIVATVSGNSNPKFVSGIGSLTAFKEAVVRISKAVKDSLQQERVQVSFWEVNDFVYLEPEGSGGDQRWYK